MVYGNRKNERVSFEHGIPVHIMGIDGTWRRDCMMLDVSQTGARLRVEESLEGLNLKDSFCFSRRPASSIDAADWYALPAMKSVSIF